MPARGRPKRFPECPECGHNGGLDLYGVRKAGQCVSVYCTCPACGIRLRYVIAGDVGYWVKVKESPGDGEG